ncbi:MAG: MerR family transcriptional regulator [Lentisphaeria bacterium]|nr:MerR family transcriptional regulator [Lentisphaeria bacterium]
MGNDGKLYSVSDLAASLNVPRTTVNDWLRKYDRYIDFEMRGRRKVYTDSSLEVLKIISSARDGGTGASELEAELAARCAVRPEISPLHGEGPLPPEAAPASGGEDGSNLPAVNFDVRNFLHEFEQRENWQTRTRRRGFLIVSVLLVLLLIVSCVSLLLLGQLLTLRESSRNLESRLAASQNETKLLREKTEKEFRAIAAKVDAAERSGSTASAELRRSLEARRGQFEAALAQMEKAAKFRDREIVRLEKENSRLKAELDTAAQLLNSRQNALTRTEGELAKAGLKIRELEKRLSSPEKEKPSSVKAALPAKDAPAEEKKHE